MQAGLFFPISVLILSYSPKIDLYTEFQKWNFEFEAVYFSKKKEMAKNPRPQKIQNLFGNIF